MTRLKSYTFSELSLSRLSGVHPLLQMIAYEGLRQMDIAVDCGRRTLAEQERLFHMEPPRTKTMHSMHVPSRFGGPALAMDLCPCVEGRRVEEVRYFHYMGGVLETLAMLLGVPLVWGGDWNSNGNFGDQDFNDLYHFQADYKRWEVAGLFKPEEAKALLERHSWGELAIRGPLE